MRSQAKMFCVQAGRQRLDVERPVQQGVPLLAIDESTDLHDLVGEESPHVGIKPMQYRAFGRGAVADMPDLGGQITRYRRSSRAATAGLSANSSIPRVTPAERPA
ncbi:hypothetical protein AU198_15535 [Mycobacterium sp. GA-1199]|nr:hypothetical protein AU198_15535 [Mycobacterium sp. GA-1199]